MPRRVRHQVNPGTDGLLSTVFDVELCAAGIEYPLASGPRTFTPEDLQSAVASQSDPAVQAPRVWLGHADDQRFHVGRSSLAASAEPALGKVTGLRVEDAGMTLVGDIQGCPTWLAKILSSAYPSRSIEAKAGAQTVTGHEWDLVITDLALLGVVHPGVSTLQDLEVLYSEDGPEVDIVEQEPVSIAAASSLEAQINVDDIRRRFHEKMRHLGREFWWVRAMQLSPDELIVDDDEGGLHRFGFSVNGDKIEFTDGVPVQVEYVTASQAQDPDARALATSIFVAGHTVLASWSNRAESQSTTNEEAGTMNPEQIKLLRERLGLTAEQLPDDATEEQVTAALTASSDAGDQTPDPDETSEEAPAEGTPAEETAPEAIAASAALPEGYIAVPAQAWETVQANAAAGAQMATQAEGTRRDEIVASACREGRIAPAQRETFRRMFDTDPQGTEVLLTAAVAQGGIMPGTIPTAARGVDVAASEGATEEVYPSEWLPEVAARKAAGDFAITNAGD